MLDKTTEQQTDQDCIEQLKAASSSQREKALVALGLLKSAHAIPHIAALLEQEKVESTRQQAAKTLGDIGSPDALLILIGLLKSNESSAVRGSAAYSLGKLTQPSAIPALTACIQDQTNDFEVRLKAYLALAGFETPLAWNALRDTLAKGVHPGLRPRIITSLGKAKYTPAIPEIRQALARGEEEDTRRAAIKAAVAIEGADCIPVLAKLLKEEGQTRLHLRVIEQFRELEDPAVIPPMCQALIEIPDDDVRDALKKALKDFGDWKNKADCFLKLLQENLYVPSGLPAEEIITAIAPTPEELLQNRYVLTDWLIEKVSDDPDARMLEILGALIRASAYGDQNAAGERLNKFEREGRFSKEKLDRLRICVGGEKALSPMLAKLDKDLEEYFRIPIQKLNDTTLINWQTTIRYAQFGFITRIVMSVMVFLAGITLVSISSYQFMFKTLDIQQLFGNGVSFVSGLATMLLIIFTGPLKEIRSAVDDLGTANAAFIAYVHRVLQTSHTFSLYYLQQRMSFEEMQKSSTLIQEAMNQTVDRLSQRAKAPNLDNDTLSTKLEELAKKLN